MESESWSGRLPSVYLSHSETETQAFAERLARSLSIPVRILLEGELGAGKTTFTRGLAEGFGVSDVSEVSSPTFTLVNRYHGRVPVYHVDLYRVESGDIYDLGLEEILEDHGSVTVIEWAERLGDRGVEGGLRVFLEYVDQNTRRIEIERGSATGIFS